MLLREQVLLKVLFFFLLYFSFEVVGLGVPLSTLLKASSSVKVIWEKKGPPDSSRLKLLRNATQFIGDIKPILGSRYSCVPGN